MIDGIKAHSFRLVSTEEACVVAFLHNNIGDARLIVFLQLNARIPDSQELIMENLHTRAFFISAYAEIGNFIEKCNSPLWQHYCADEFAGNQNF